MTKYLTVGTNEGYKVFSLNPVKLIFEKLIPNGVIHVLPINKGTIVAFVGSGETPDVPTTQLK